jgi:hypothetical protein
MDDAEIFNCVELAELLTRLRGMESGEAREQILGTVGEVVFVRREDNPEDACS